MIADTTDSLVVDAYCGEEQYAEEWDIAWVCGACSWSIWIWIFSVSDELKEMGRDGLKEEVKGTSSTGLQRKRSTGRR